MNAPYIIEIYQAGWLEDHHRGAAEGGQFTCRAHAVEWLIQELETARDGADNILEEDAYEEQIMLLGVLPQSVKEWSSPRMPDGCVYFFRKD